MEDDVEERAAIVARYDLGRGAGAVIHEWEDPDKEIFHTQDRYGFIHDKRLPDARSRSERERKQIELERSREMKWAEMLREEPKYFGGAKAARHREKMINRVHKGVPDAFRGRLWYVLLDLARVKSEQEGKYARMLEASRTLSPHLRQIDLDVNRTYRDHVMFMDRYNQKQRSLFHVLAAYSVYNEEVGYCQGMSQIAALMMMYLAEEEDAFWALSQLMANPRWAMHGLFVQGFPKLIRFQSHHDKVLRKMLPKLKKHLDKQGIDTGIYTLKWFFQCFLDRVPFSLALRVWDLYLLEGERILTSMAYNILHMHRRFLRTLDMDRVIEHLQMNLGRNFGYDDDVVVERLREATHELRSHRLDWPGRPPTDELPQKPFGMVKAASTPPSRRLVANGGGDLGVRTPMSAQEREIGRRAIRRQAEAVERANDDDVDDDGSGSEETPSSPSSRLDDSVRMMLETADLNGHAAASSAADTSFDSDKLRIHVSYDKEDAAAAAAAKKTASYDGNTIRIAVRSELSSPGLVSKADGRGNSSSSSSQKQPKRKSKKKHLSHKPDDDGGEQLQML